MRFDVRVTQPGAASRAFAEAISGGDVGAALACWSDDAVIVGPDGTTVRGRAALSARFEQLVRAGVRLEIAVGDVVVAGSVAMGETRMAMTAPDGTLPLRFRGTVLYTRTANRWQIAVDRVAAES